jgi:hypothetical protein
MTAWGDEYFRKSHWLISTGNARRHRLSFALAAYLSAAHTAEAPPVCFASVAVRD